MKQIKNIFRSKKFQLFTAAIIAFLVVGCVYIDQVSVMQTHDGKEVSYAYAGEVATFTMRGHIECHENHSGVHFVVGFCAPKGWNVAQNAKVTYKCDLADDRSVELPMHVIPSGSLPKNGGGKTWVECLTQEYGVGPNVLDDMEWVVFQTDAGWDIINNQTPYYTIYIRTNVGTKNLKCHIGFFVNHTDDGFSTSADHKKMIFSPECFEVVEGQGMTTDFCNRHFNKVSPMSSLQNDYITFSFLGDVAPTELSKLGEVYFQGTAFTTSGKSYTVNTRDERTKMKRENTYSNNYNITMWPVGFFNVPITEQIDSIHYFFSNKEGSMAIGQSDDDHVQLGTALPQQMKPFTFQFVCD